MSRHGPGSALGSAAPRGPGAAGPDPSTGEPPARWGMLALLAAAELLGMSLWFTASAVSPLLAQEWHLGPGGVAWLTTIVQLGFVAGTATAAVLNLADLFPARRYFAACALLGALANAALLWAPGYAAALALRFATGFLLAGVYPPAMKMIATWFRDGRGLAIGTIVGALTIGKATPWLVDAMRGAGVGAVVGTASAGAAVAGLLVLFGYRDGPFAFERRAFSWRLVGAVLRHRPTRLAIAGYLGHMWELYAMWTAMGGYFLAFFTLNEHARPAFAAAAATFAVIGAGGAGAVAAGLAADRWGRERIASMAMVVSGLCSLTVGWLLAAPAGLVLALGVVWGATIVADSAQFSALVTEVAPRHAVGTALTLQTALGFALTAASIWLVFQIAAAWGWGPAFSMLALGPVAGIAAMVRLARVRQRTAPPGTASRRPA